MSLRTYDTSPDYTERHGDVLSHIDPRTGVISSEKRQLQPGDWVACYGASGRGMVVSVAAEAVTVLWSIEPRNDTGYYKPPPTKQSPGFNVDLVINVQTPPGLSGDEVAEVFARALGSKVECNLDTSLGMMYRRTVTWVRTRTLRLTSSVRSWWAWLRSRSTNAASTPVRGWRLP